MVDFESILGSLLAPLWLLWAPVGALLAPLWALLAPFWTFLGKFWDPFGSNLKKGCKNKEKSRFLAPESANNSKKFTLIVNLSLANCLP